MTICANAHRNVGRVPKSGVSKYFGCLKEVRLFPKSPNQFRKEITAMQTLHETELSYTQDHKLDLNGMARTLLEDLVNTVMVEQVEELGCVRNGYRERKLVTSVGTLTLKFLNSVKGVTRSMANPLSRRTLRSLACVTTLQLTYTIFFWAS